MSNAVTLGDRCHGTMKRMEKMGIEPVPVKFDACYDFYHSGLDCADADVWRENDPVKEIPEGPSPISNA